jgi:hypothetical protein
VQGLTEPPFVDFIDVVAVRDALNFIPIKAQVQILAGDIDPFSCAQDRGRGRPMRKRKEGGTGGGRERREREIRERELARVGAHTRIVLPVANQISIYAQACYAG